MKRSLRSWLWRVPIDQEVDDEIAFHVEMRTRELVDKGLDHGSLAKWCSRVLVMPLGSSGPVWTFAESEIERCD